MTYIGFDIGGTKCAACLGVKREGGIDIVAKRAFPTPKPWQAAVEALFRAAEELLRAHGEPVSACGFSCGGSDLAAKKKADGLMAGAGAKVKRTPETYLAVIDGQVQLLQPPAEPQSSLLDTVRPLIAALRTMRAAKKQTTNE